MHDDDPYDQIHAELASGEGMPEAHQPHALRERATPTRPGDGSGTAIGPRPNA